MIRTERGSIQTYDFEGNCLEIDVTNTEAWKFIWEKCKKNYYDYGIDMFWLDNAEPDYAVYDNVAKQKINHLLLICVSG